MKDRVFHVPIEWNQINKVKKIPIKVLERHPPTVHDEIDVIVTVPNDDCIDEIQKRIAEYDLKPSMYGLFSAVQREWDSQTKMDGLIFRFKNATEAVMMMMVITAFCTPLNS